MSRVAKGIRTALVAAAVAGFSVSVAAPPAAAAKECKSSVSGSSKGKFKIKKAKNLARASWRGAGGPWRQVRQMVQGQGQERELRQERPEMVLHHERAPVQVI